MLLGASHRSERGGVAKKTNSKDLSWNAKGGKGGANPRKREIRAPPQTRILLTEIKKMEKKRDYDERKGKANEPYQKGRGGRGKQGEREKGGNAIRGGGR